MQCTHDLNPSWQPAALHCVRIGMVRSLVLVAVSSSFHHPRDRIRKGSGSGSGSSGTIVTISRFPDFRGFLKFFPGHSWTGAGKHGLMAMPGFFWFPKLRVGLLQYYNGVE